MAVCLRLPWPWYLRVYFVNWIFVLFSYERISPLNELFPISTSRITTKTVSSVPRRRRWKCCGLRHQLKLQKRDPGRPRDAWREKAGFDGRFRKGLFKLGGYRPHLFEVFDCLRCRCQNSVGATTEGVFEDGMSIGTNRGELIDPLTSPHFELSCSLPRFVTNDTNRPNWVITYSVFECMIA